MVNNANWLLPEGVEEILPTEALELEMLRRKLIDDFTAKGFSLVMPPIMEFADALLSGTGTELDTQTYKFMDQHTNRMLGIRADITPQIARIDSHYLAHNDVNRLCYSSTVLRTKPAEMGGQRELQQTGVEIFGVEGTDADKEVIAAMLDALALAKVEQLTLSLSHVALYRCLISRLELSELEEANLQNILLRKSTPELIEFNRALDGKLSSMVTLISLQGGVDVVAEAKNVLPQDRELHLALEELQETIEFVEEAYPEVNIHLDLSDVAGYRYYTGLKHSAYIPGRGRTVAKGGRYDSIGEHFGRARPATGFSLDLKTLVKLGHKV